jgi:hypothetical protein
VRGVLVTAVICLAVGIGVFFGYCHGTTGVQFDFPVSATAIHLDITTTGVPAIVGPALTLVGAFLLIVATIIALVGMFGRKGEAGPARRRENAFEE